jgi:pSer/pThr/pTyr-binding forkhead associated (FHA) protein
MLARLVALDEGPDIILERGGMVVGRHPACDTRLDFPRVSRHHCFLTLEDGELIVKDLGSTNGIRVNGLRVEVGRLRNGDELAIANLRYRFEAGPLLARFSMESLHSPPPPPTNYPHPSDPTWPWVRRAGLDFGPLDGED